MKSMLFNFSKVSYGVATGGWLYLYLELFKVVSEDLMFNKEYDQFIYIRSKNNRIECKLKDKNVEFIRLNE